MNEAHVPSFQQYMNPILAALHELGEAVSIETLDAKVVEDMKISRENLGIPHKADVPDRSEVSYRMAWARTYLKKAGLLDNPIRGMWTLSETGLITKYVDPLALASRYSAKAKADPGEAAEADTANDTKSGDLLDPMLKTELRTLFDSMLARGSVLRAEQATVSYQRFRERFGPEVLASLDGERLLSNMHGRQTKDSLVYWIEFKDDDEFPAKFGSISGGSALKFGIYQNKNGDWWTGATQKQIPLTLDNAIDFCRVQRNQLIQGAAVLDSFAKRNQRDYAELQTQMMEAAPDLAETAWGHKYFSLLYPEILDDYHALTYQQYHLIKLLQVPKDGRYANAEFLVRIANELSILPTQLGTILNQRDGSPHNYWRVGTTTNAGDPSEWPRMRDSDFVSIGWSELGDLSHLMASKESKDELRARMAEVFYPTNAGVATRKTQELFNFVVTVQERDVFVAMSGDKVKGIGVVRGPYYFQDGDGPFAHRRRVEWRDITEWKFSDPEARLTTFFKLGNKQRHNLVDVERRLLSLAKQPRVSSLTPQPLVKKPLAELTGIPARVQAALNRKLQVILYGPPGTGKTYWAERAIWELVARDWFGKEAGELSSDEQESAREQGAFSSCTFHPAYGYEDFIEGYRPFEADGAIGFRLQPGLFKAVCNRAKEQPQRPYFILIDEINRGDIPRIFGELLTLLEKDKRGRTLSLPVSGDSFLVPGNVRIIGTMNTADRSIALLDVALRRRFSFVELMPDPSALGNAKVAGLPLGPWLSELNERIVKNVGRDARNLQVGHAYLMQGDRGVTDPARFWEVFRDDVVPLLEEYCYGDYEALASILGSPLIQSDKTGGVPRLVEFNDAADLITALLQSFEGLATAPETIAAVGTEDTADLDDETELNGDDES